jgi:hypothetical protein
MVTMFAKFETICYRSRNHINTYLSGSKNILGINDYLHGYQRGSPKKYSPSKSEDKRDSGSKSLINS